MSLEASTSSTSAKKGTQVICAPSSPIKTIETACVRIAGSDANVLITGETGTGKEVFARLIHTRSKRSQSPFVPVNCGAIPESLVESELFGYVRGAFTGASTSRQGRVALAENGTLFLDEIGELPLAMQVKLLRVLQERTYEPVGSARSLPANFRLIAATNRDLAAEVQAGRFRQDLFYRLMVCPLELPALRKRRADVSVLFRHFWAARGENRPLDPQIFRTLEAYDWPGNVRELENLVERLSVCVDGAQVHLSDLPPNFRHGHDPRSGEPIELMSGAGNANAETMHSVGDSSDTFEAPTPLPIPFDLLRPASPSSLDELEPFSDTPTNVTTPTPIRPIEVSDSSAHQLGLPVGVAEFLKEGALPNLPLPVDLPGLLRKIEDAYIAAALTQSTHNKKAAAELLGMQRTTLVEKLRRRSRDTSQS